MLRLPSSLSIIVLVLLLASSQAGLFSNTNRNSNATSTTATTKNEETITWFIDLISLPADVPFPGFKWLDRFPEDHTLFEFHGETYSSVYAAILQNEPLRHPARNLNCYINSIFIPTFVAESIALNIPDLSLAHYVISYLRNLLAGILVYYGTAGIFHYFCYIHPSTSKVFQQGRQRPSNAIIWHQIRLAQASLFLYTLLPVVDEYLIEQNLTFMYYTVDEIGGYVYYAISMVVYFTLVEIGVYWMHRTLHTNKTLYKYIHLMHHQYNKPETLTPWASIAFHPLDGILQASPYEFAMFLVPCHYLTHILLIFFTAIWATYIHDAMDFNVDPIMGSKYHTVHHTHYIYNYGQVFTFCDRFWGTLRIPTEPTGGTAKQILKKVS